MLADGVKKRKTHVHFLFKNISDRFQAGEFPAAAPYVRHHPPMDRMEHMGKTHCFTDYDFPVPDSRLADRPIPGGSIGKPFPASGKIA